MLNSNRDFRRKNRATLAVQGSIYSKISMSSLEMIKCTINDPKNNKMSQSTRYHINNSIDIALKSTKQTIECMLLSQQEINTRTCFEYAQQQHSTMT